MKRQMFLLRQKVFLLLPALLCLIVFNATAQDGTLTVKGFVRSDTARLSGVTVFLKSDSSRMTVTDESGVYSLRVPTNGTLVFTSVGFRRKEVEVRGEPTINVILQPDQQSLDEVAVVAYGTQKKSSMVSAVTTVNPKDLKGPTSNLTTMLAGRVPGVIAYQRSGEPGADNAQFFIRGVATFGAGKKDPLILIDGIESSATDFARLQPDDIATFSVLQDATASSMYGARGANGVYLVTTKKGTEGKTRYNVRFENAVSSTTRNFDYADNITYMKLANEAVVARDDAPILTYSREKIEKTAEGADPLLYPNNDWLKLMIKDYTVNQRFNFNVNGGGKVAQFYISGTYNVDNGLLREENLNAFNNNIKLKNYSVRSNITINVTPTTVVNVRTYAQFDDYRGPIGSGATYFEQALRANPVAFPAIYPSSFAPTLRHPLFGNMNAGTGNTYSYQNPYANAVSGYQQRNSSNINAQVDIQQNLGFLVEGLSARMMAYTNRDASFNLSRQYDPFYYKLTLNPVTEKQELTSLNVGREYLSYSPGDKNLGTMNYLDAAVNYTTTIAKKHNVSGMLTTLLQSTLNANAGSLQASLPRRNQGLSGRFTYGYDNRYLLEMNFGYNGSERFHKDHRFGFFPSIGAGWNIHNEEFFKNLGGAVRTLKIRGTYGIAGNDEIGSAEDRFFYLSNMNMQDGGKSATFGEEFNFGKSGISVVRYENRAITWELTKDQNLGMDLALWNSLNITIDAWRKERSQILMDRADVPNTMGLNAQVKANVGKAETKGIQAQVQYNKSLNKKTRLSGWGNMTFATCEFIYNEEPDYPEYWRSRVGHSLSQQWGLIAERLFVDDAEVANSPIQEWGRVRAGDIKYRDVNGDGVINGDGDLVPIGYPTEPEITYGVGFTLSRGSFDISAFFQGSARSSIFIDNNAIQPFRQSNGFENNLLSEIANDHWSEDNRNIYAFWPRLSNYTVQNNQWTSTWWMRDGTFLRLKQVDLGYNVPDRLLRKAGLSACRLYLSTFNLFVISKFKMWDPEMGGNGLGYPPQRSLNIGINVNL